MKKVIYAWIYLLFFVPKTLRAQSSVVELTRQITEGRASDLAKIEAIYDWLIQNIAYDNARKRQLEGDTMLRQEPYNVVIIRKAVCMGYAKTLREMCRLSGIEAYLVEGYVKSPQGIVQREGHAWNVAKLNNNWCLLDATWDAGLAISEKKYFLRDPSVFIENHLPHDPIWQLLKAPISIKCFQNTSDCNDAVPMFSAFNFADSIRHWQSLDSTQQVYNQSIRILKFNPDDVNALRDLADLYCQKAKQTYSEYKQIRQEVANKKRLPNKKSAVLKLLDTTINYLNSALNNYQKLVKLKSQNTLTDIDLNLDAIQETLLNLANEKAAVAQYFKE
jgi:hypothetical protein